MKFSDFIVDYWFRYIVIDSMYAHLHIHSFYIYIIWDYIRSFQYLTVCDNDPFYIFWLFSYYYHLKKKLNVVEKWSVFVMNMSSNCSSFDESFKHEGVLYGIITSLVLLHLGDWAAHLCNSACNLLVSNDLLFSGMIRSCFISRMICLCFLAEWPAYAYLAESSAHLVEWGWWMRIISTNSGDVR